MGMKIILGEEYGYVKRLEKAFYADIHPGYEVMCFSDKRNILAQFSLHGADVIVVSAGFGLSEKNFAYQAPVFYFSERKPNERNEIFKYQNLNDMLCEIARKYQDFM